MEGSQGIIGNPLDNSVFKYTLLGSSPRQEKMADDKQTLLFTSFNQDEGRGVTTEVCQVFVRGGGE